MRQEKYTKLQDKGEALLLQKELVNVLKKKNSFKSKQVENAFLSVPRHLFLPGIELENVYSDKPIVTKWKGRKAEIPLSSSTQPAAMAIMLEQLGLKKGISVLEIGAGTGFNAALMAEIVGKKGQVVSVDIDKEICSTAKKNLNSAGYGNVKVVCKDGFSGYKPCAPYDRIIITVGSWDVSLKWFQQLKSGGILVAPLITKFDQMTIAFKKKNNHLDSVSVSGCKFMGFRGKHLRKANIKKLGKKEEVILFGNDKLKLIKNNIYESLNKTGKDIPTGVSVTERELSLGLSPWLEISEPNHCIISTTIEFAKRTKLPTVPNNRNRDFSSAYATLIDDENICLLVRSPNKGKPELIGLNVRNFGKNEILEKHLVNRIQQWDRAGHPNIYNLKVRAYFGKKAIKPIDKEYSILKKHVTLLYSWKSSGSLVVY